MATVDPNNTALTNLVSTKNQLINEAQANYNSASQGASQKYNELIQASKDYGEKQAEIQEQKTNQTIAEINQQKDKASRDYTKEQKGAYVDYARQTNDTGVNAEKMAVQGLTGSGYQETSKVSMYNAYQNRIALARESYNDAILNYDNQITQARLANSATLAEIAYNSLQTQLQLSLEGLQYENELLQQLTNTKLNVNTSYDNLWQSMYNTILNENQFNEQMNYQKERDKVADSQWEKQYQLSLANSRRSSSGGSRSSSKSSGKSKGSSDGLVLKDDSNGSIDGNNASESSNSWADNFMQVLIDQGDTYTTGQFERSLNNFVRNGKITQAEANAIRQESIERGIYKPT